MTNNALHTNGSPDESLKTSMMIKPSTSIHPPLPESRGQDLALGMKVIVVPPDLNWPADFGAEAGQIRSALGDVALALHHIGSTAIPGIHAKPIIDILLEVEDMAALDARSAALVELSYEPKGEFGIPGRRYFSKDSVAKVRTHQIHAFEKGSVGLQRHVAFRGYMIAHPSIAQDYSLLKRRMAEAHPDDIEAYMDGKDAFIKEHEAKAMMWK